MGLLGILVALGLLIWLAYRGWSVLLLAPAAAILAAGLAGEPLLAHWTQTFMGSAARFVMQFFPIFLLGALFGKLMEDSGSVSAIASFMTERLGPRARGAGGRTRRRAGHLWRRQPVRRVLRARSDGACAVSRGSDPEALMPAAIALGTSTFTMSALPGTPAIQNAIPMPFFGTTPFAAPGLGIIASVIMLGFGLWWLARAEAARAQEGRGLWGGRGPCTSTPPEDQIVRERATTAGTFDPAEIRHGDQSDAAPPIALAASAARHRRRASIS